MLDETSTRTLEAAQSRELLLAVYSVPKEAYEKRLIPAFQRQWKQRTGEDIRFRSSYGASGAQARAIIGGFEADVAALSVQGDLDQVVKAGLVTHDWRNGPHHGNVTASVVALGIRKGNPKGIKTWEDLAKPGVDVLYPNPKTSGGAMWDIIAIYGAGLKLPDPKQGSPEISATNLLKRIQKNVKVMDKSGRESVTTFERGVGDVIVTYENELLPRIKSGRPIELIIPDQTVLIENPVAVVDRHVEKHRVRDVAEAFVAFLHSDEAQRAFMEADFRPVSEGLVQASHSFSRPAHLFTIADLGGWDKIATLLFGPQGLWPRTVEELAKGK
ncbi:MAG TPA: sulfate ABC transporter substrate-binding protein [Nitrospiraceae bacterium]|nr:sulfate ABC transporter substrate-binding protein [Nitrospiraceae bacterium]